MGAGQRSARSMRWFVTALIGSPCASSSYAGVAPWLKLVIVSPSPVFASIHKQVACRRHEPLCSISVSGRRPRVVAYVHPAGRSGTPRGFAGLPLAIALVSWFFKYCFILIDSIVTGAAEPPVLSVEMINPINEQRPLGQALLIAGGVALAVAVGKAVGAGLGWLVEWHCCCCYRRALQHWG